jgi:cell wall-associated NlpC family hydrolase
VCIERRGATPFSDARRIRRARAGEPRGDGGRIRHLDDGGVDPSGFDCSGFVKYVFEQHGVTMPRDTRRQYEVGAEVRPTALAPGDLVFFSTVAPGASHVGIVVGGDQFVHAPSSRGVVRVEHLSSQYWSSRFVGARRVY